MRIRITAKRPEVAALIRRKLGSFPAILRRCTEETAVETCEHLKDAIRGESSPIVLRLRAITEPWRARKEREGLEEGTLRRLDLYVNAIVCTGAKVHVVAGPYPFGGISYGELAKFLEYGTAGMDPIPHWSIARQWAARRLKRRLRDQLRKEFSGAGRS